ncbi:phosphatase PAP2 family protein [Caulobacter segnis]|uniref:Phosphoesterase PA-phosphatase related protein n=2 Tax=Caulobacter segnis TaxID=88688 RepID=D5VN69_CAUST|nr:phosphatase PAP2 family protein [Caulobacter segnis]ADG11942.1 phosphoesterase PA-phosphatase related protein [Caulobacter segnis ATCC 21756]
MFHLDVRRLVAVARREIGAASALLIAALGGMGFLAIADEVAEGETHALDLAVLRALRVEGRPQTLVGPDWLHVAAVDVTALGSVAVLSLIILLAFALLASLRRWGEGVLLLAGAVGGVSISQGLKLVFGRERPDMAYRAVEAVNASFPSGHAMLSAVVFLTLGVLTARFADRRRVKVLAISAAVLLSLLVGASRVYLGVHWASDVLAGWCVGGAWAMACWLLAYLVRRRLKPPSALDAT